MMLDPWRLPFCIRGRRLLYWWKYIIIATKAGYLYMRPICLIGVNLWQFLFRGKLLVADLILEIFLTALFCGESARRDIDAIRPKLWSFLPSKKLFAPLKCKTER